MWYLEKKIVVSSAHHLKDYDGPCAKPHGHNWNIIVRCKSQVLDKIGMVVDFRLIKEALKKFDHANLNELMPENPTAENIAKHICDFIPRCYEVEVEETEGSVIRYVKAEN